MKAIYSSNSACTRYFVKRAWLWIVVAIMAVYPLQAFTQVIEWDRTYGGSAMDNLSQIQKTEDGGYLLAGYSDSGISGDKTVAPAGYWVVKIDANGIKEWDKVFEISTPYLIKSFQLTMDGGIIIGGQTNPYFDAYTPANQDYWVIKLDAAGNIEWERTLGGPESDFFAHLIQTDDGGYLLGGDSYSGIGGDKTEPRQGAHDFWIVKLNASGEIEWDKTIGRAGQVQLTVLVQTRDGGYMVGGYTWGAEYDYLVVKLDAKGNIEWQNTYGGGKVDLLYTLIQTSDGGYLLGGVSQSNISGDKSEPNRDQCPSQPGGCSHDFWVVKIDALGNKEWDKTLGSSTSETLTAIEQTKDGGYIVGGHSSAESGFDKTEDSRGGWDYWVVKLDASGNIQWDKTIGGNNNDLLTSLQLASDGGYILGGFSGSGPNGDKTEPSRGGGDYWIVKLSEAGTCLPPNPTIALSPTSDVYTGGDPTTIYLGYGPQNVQLVASGATRYEWSSATGLSSTTAADPVFTPASAGSYTFTLTAYNGTCAATAEVTITVIDVRCDKGRVLLCHQGKLLCIPAQAAEAHLRNHPGDRLGSCTQGAAVGAVVALRAFPNPFRDWTRIEFSLPAGGDYRLELHSANGRLVGVVTTGWGNAGQLVTHELQDEKLREGIYYLRLHTSDGVQTTRLVLKK